MAMKAGVLPVRIVAQSLKRTCLISRDFEQAWAACDVILAPTTPNAAFALGDKLDDPLAMYLNDVFSVPASLAGLPAMSVPAGLNSTGLPLGLQVIGKPFDEQGVLDAGLAIEQRAEFSARPEKLVARVLLRGRCAGQPNLRLTRSLRGRRTTTGGH